MNNLKTPAPSLLPFLLVYFYGGLPLRLSFLVGLFRKQVPLHCGLCIFLPAPPKPYHRLVHNFVFGLMTRQSHNTSIADSTQY